MSSQIRWLGSSFGGALWVDGCAGSAAATETFAVQHKTEKIVRALIFIDSSPWRAGHASVTAAVAAFIAKAWTPLNLVDGVLVVTSLLLPLGAGRADALGR